MDSLKCFGYSVLVDDVVYFYARVLSHAVFLAGVFYVPHVNCVEVRHSENLNILFWRNGNLYA